MIVSLFHFVHLITALPQAKIIKSHYISYRKALDTFSLRISAVATARHLEYRVSFLLVQGINRDLG